MRVPKNRSFGVTDGGNKTTVCGNRERRSLFSRAVVFLPPPPERRTTMKDTIRRTAEFKSLRAEAREAIAAYEDGADFLFTISRLAAIGEQMNVLLA